MLVDFPTDPSWVFAYDTSAALNQKDRLASVGNGIVATELEYTAQGQVAVERTLIDGGSYAVTYAYDAGGNLASLTAPSGVTTSDAYSGSRPKDGHRHRRERAAGDPQPRVPALRPEDARRVPARGRSRARTPSSARASYNLRYQVTEIDVTTPTETVLDLRLSPTTTRPAHPAPSIPGRISIASSTTGTGVRAASTSTTTSTGSGRRRTSRGRRSTRTPTTPTATAPSRSGPSGTTNYSHESGTDRLSQATGAEANQYAHDVYGSRIWSGASAYSGTPSHVYDDSNRLREVARPRDACGARAYTYDAFGRRVRKVTGAVTTLFFYDSRRASRRDADARNVTGDGAALRLHRGRACGRGGPGDRRVALVRLGAWRPANDAACSDEFSRGRRGDGDLASALRPVWACHAG